MVTESALEDFIPTSIHLSTSQSGVDKMNEVLYFPVDTKMAGL